MFVKNAVTDSHRGHLVLGNASPEEEIHEKKSSSSCAGQRLTFNRRCSVDHSVLSLKKQIVEMNILKEFKEFAIKGNMIEMAVGIVIGASFNSVVDVLVKNILLPPISLLSNGVNIQHKKIILRKGTSDLSQVSIDYGYFVNTLVDFLVVGFTIFVVIKFFNALKRKSEDVNEPSVQTPKEIVLLTQIKDLLEQIHQKDSPNKPKA